MLSTRWQTRGLNQKEDEMRDFLLTYKNKRTRKDTRQVEEEEEENEEEEEEKEEEEEGEKKEEEEKEEDNYKGLQRNTNATNIRVNICFSCVFLH